MFFVCIASLNGIATQKFSASAEFRVQDKLVDVVGSFVCGSNDAAVREKLQIRVVCLLLQLGSNYRLGTTKIFAES